MKQEEARLKRALKKLEKAGVEAFRPEWFPQDDRLRCRHHERSRRAGGSRKGGNPQYNASFHQPGGPALP